MVGQRAPRFQRHPRHRSTPRAPGIDAGDEEDRCARSTCGDPDSLWPVEFPNNGFKWDSNHTALLWLKGTYTTAQFYNLKVVGTISSK
jgi:hypothetical protein